MEKTAKMTGTYKRLPSPTSRADEERPRNRARVEMPTLHQFLSDSGNGQRTYGRAGESMTDQRAPSLALAPVPTPTGDEEYARRLQRMEKLAMNPPDERQKDFGSGLRQPHSVPALSGDEHRLRRLVRKEKFSRPERLSFYGEREKKSSITAPASPPFATPAGTAELTRLLDRANKYPMEDVKAYAREKTFGSTTPAPARPRGSDIPTPRRFDRMTPITYDEQQKKSDLPIPARPTAVDEDTDDMRADSISSPRAAPSGPEFNFDLPTPSRAFATKLPIEGQDAAPIDFLSPGEQQLHGVIYEQNNRIAELEMRLRDTEKAAAKSEAARAQMACYTDQVRTARDRLAKELAAEKQKAETNEGIRVKVDLMWVEYKKRHG